MLFCEIVHLMEFGCQGLNRQERSSKSRSYQMRRRAEQVDQTHQRIVEAAAGLHGTIGPAATTITGIAKEAGVTRLTVYRHFAGEDAILAACSAHWLAQQVPPDPRAWARFADPVERLQAGLTDLYRFYREGVDMLTWIYRDMADLPPQRRAAIAQRDGLFREVLLEPFVATKARRRQLGAVLGHATAFWTWRSLCIEHGLSDREATDAMTAMAVAVVGHKASARTAGRRG